MLIYIVVVCLVAWYLKCVWDRRHLVQLARTLKSGIKCPPFIGEFTYAMYGDSKATMAGIQFMGKDALQAGGTVGHWFFNKLYLTIADPEIGNIILKGCLEKDDVTRFFHDILGDGSIFTTVEKWRPRRKFLALVFNMKSLNHFVEIFAAESSVFTEQLKKVEGKGPIASWDMFSYYTMNSICRTTLGIEPTAHCKQFFSELLNNIFIIVVKRICTPWLHVDFFFQLSPWAKKIAEHKAQLSEYIDDVVKEYSRNMQCGQNVVKSDKPKPFVERVLESAEENKEVLIQEESLVLFGAGTDTTAVSLGFIFLMLARHPDVQEKLYQEVFQLFGDDDRAVQADDLHRLEYLDAVIKETLRLYPPVPIIFRKIDLEITLPSGVTVPPGCSTAINIWAMHRNPACWGADAEEFRPERFLEPTPRHPAAFIPFSFGPRNCLGFQYTMMSIKTLLVTVLREFRLTAAHQRPLQLEYDIMMRDVDRYVVGYEKR